MKGVWSNRARNWGLERGDHERRGKVKRRGEPKLGGKPKSIIRLRDKVTKRTCTYRKVKVRIAGRYLRETDERWEANTRAGTSGRMGARKGANVSQITGSAAHEPYATLTKQVAGEMERKC